MENIDVDIDVDGFLSSCSDYEIKEVIEWLKEQEWINEDSDDENENQIPFNKQNIYDQEWYSLCDKLSRIRLQLTQREEETIRKILNKHY
jgi:hypothetical protein